MDRRFLLATVLFPLVSIAVGVVALLVASGRLPDQVVVGWGLSGEPTRSVDRGAFVALFAGWSAVVGGLLAVLAHAVRNSIAGWPLAGAPAALVWFLAALMGAAAASQTDPAGDAAFPWWVLALSPIVGAAGWFVAMRLAGPPAAVPVSDAPAPARAARADIGAGHTAVWVGRTPPARTMLVMGAAVLALGVGLGAIASWWLLSVFVPLAVLVAASSGYRVAIGRRMIDISGSAFGYPRLRIPLEQVSEADLGTVDAWSFGGWGIRVGHGGETAVLTRSGPALVVTRTDGSVVRVSLDSPGDAAAVVNALLDRRR